MDQFHVSAVAAIPPVDHRPGCQELPNHFSHTQAGLVITTSDFAQCRTVIRQHPVAAEFGSVRGAIFLIKL
jgi:hypothetical protein